MKTPEQSYLLIAHLLKSGCQVSLETDYTGDAIAIVAGGFHALYLERSARNLITAPVIVDRLNAASASGTEAAVCRDIAARQKLGLSKYGQSVADNPADLRRWLQHAYEEALDAAVYLRRAMDEMDKTPR